MFIHAAASLPALLPAFMARFAGCSVLPLAPRDGGAASRVLVRGIKGSRVRRSRCARAAPRTAEGRTGLHRPEFDAIFRGLARLVW
ncbi:MAG: hypothetical protein U5N53_09500 [Mycobacterium sp.]|nr:hypothetical protein [Mycobacterium sp.]